jgi:hypothetical protein
MLADGVGQLSCRFGAGGAAELGSGYARARPDCEAMIFEKSISPRRDGRVTKNQRGDGKTIWLAAVHNRIDRLEKKVHS